MQRIRHANIQHDVGRNIYSIFNELERGENMETVRPRGTDKAEVIKVIKTTSLLGRGIPEDPVRYVHQYWDFEGNLLAKHDTLDDAMTEN